MSKQKALAFGAIGMMRELDHTMPAIHEHTSDGHMVKCALLDGVVSCRTSAPSVKHMVRANVPGDGPVGTVLDKTISVAMTAEYLRTVALLCAAWFAFDFRPTEGNASGMRQTQRTFIEETQP